MPKYSHLLLALIACVGVSLSHATITGYSNTLSSYFGSATGVTSTYTFTPLSGITKAFRKIEITNQGFSAASTPLTVLCSNLVSLPTASISTATGASQTASFSFKTSTALAVDGKISITFPAGLVTAVETAKSCEMVPNPSTLSVTDGSKLVSDNRLVIDVKVAVPAGSISVTCSGLTLAASAASVVKIDNTGTATGGLEISTSLDTFKAHISTPAVGKVSAALNALSLSKDVGSSGSASVGFIIASSFTAHASNNKITLSFPNGHVTAQANNQCGVSSPVAASTSTFGNDKVVLTVTSNLAAGSVTVTCSGLTLASMPAVEATLTGTTGLKIETSLDQQAAYVTVPATGVITEPQLTISKSVGTGGTASISFKTSTALLPSSANRITLNFPPGYVTAQADNLCVITSSSVSSTSKFSDNGKVTITLATGSTLPAGLVGITCTGLTLSAKPELVATAGGSTGLKIETSTDKTAAYVTVSAIGAISKPSLILSTAVGTGNSATISFTTSTALADTNTIVLLFPADLVEAQAADKCAITSPATKSTSAFVKADKKITVTVGAALAAGVVTVTCTDMELKAKAAVTDGLEITTTTDTQAAKVNTPATGAVLNPSLILTRAVGTGNSATISFTTSTALADTNTIVLLFPADLVEAQAADKCAITSPATKSTSAFVKADKKITITVDKATLAAGAVTVTCTDMELKAKAAVTDGLEITTAKDTVAKVNTPATGSVLNPAFSLTKTVGTGNSATISFTTSTALADTNTIVLLFPADLVEAQAADKCAITSPATKSTSAFVKADKKITVTVGAALAAGAVTVTCTDMELKAKAAVTDGLEITTLKDEIAAKVSTPATGVVTVELASTSVSALSATLGEAVAKQLIISSAVDVWTDSAAPVVTCAVSSFTNAAVSTTSRRSLLQADEVKIQVKDNTGTIVGTELSTGQSFPATVAAPPTRTLYLPKASSSVHTVAWVCVSLSILLFWL